MGKEHDYREIGELESEEPTVEELLQICQELNLQIEANESWDLEDVLAQAQGLAEQEGVDLDEELSKRGFYD